MAERNVRAYPFAASNSTNWPSRICSRSESISLFCDWVGILKFGFCLPTAVSLMSAKKAAML